MSGWRGSPLPWPDEVSSGPPTEAVAHPAGQPDHEDRARSFTSTASTAARNSLGRSATAHACPSSLGLLHALHRRTVAWGSGAGGSGFQDAADLSDLLRRQRWGRTAARAVDGSAPDRPT